MNEGTTGGAQPVPAGYVLLRALGENVPAPPLLCRKANGDEVVVRVLGQTGPDGGHPTQVESELRALAAAGDHPCAVRTTRVWMDDQLGLCLEQEHSPGGPLRIPTAEQGQVLVGAIRVTAALAHLHSHGVLHRDVRPGNVLIDAAGEWRLAGAGLTSALGASAQAAFAPRELRGWETPGPAADVYCLGATLHIALTGQPPADSLGTHRNTVVPLPGDTPAALASLVLRMLAGDPAERPTLAEIDSTLRPLVSEADRDRLPPPLTPPPLPVPPRPRLTTLSEPSAAATTQRRGVLVAIGAAVLFFAGAGAVIATNGEPDDGAAQLASAASPSPTTAPAPAAPPPAAVKTAPKPTRAPKPSPAPAKRKPKARGTTAEASGALVDQGFVPYRIAVFVYRGRLAALLHMARISPDLKGFLIYSTKPDGSDRRLGDDRFSGAIPNPGPRTIAFFFEPDVSTERCVQIDPVLHQGREFSDSRVVCTQPLSDQDRILADDGWVAYQQTQRAPQATPAPKPPATAARPA